MASIKTINRESTFLVLLSVYVTVACEQKVTCGRGHMLFSPPHGSDVCIQCQLGFSYMSKDTHTERQCYECTNIVNSSIEVLVTPCSRTHDSEIHCRPGYYRNRETRSCLPCTQCQEPTSPCQGYYDAVCCGDNSLYEAILDHDNKFICKFRHIRCSQGQFYNSDTGFCSPCPEDTYMQIKNHTQTQCLACKTISQGNSTNSIVIKNCTRTSPTLFGCQEGYFRDPLQEELTVDVPCTPCQSCPYRGRECDMFHNTVCCPGNTVSANDTHDGYTCVARAICQIGQYLWMNALDDSYSCELCPEGTYMNESNHIFTICKPCWELFDSNDVISCVSDKWYHFRWLDTYIIILYSIVFIILILDGQNILFKIFWSALLVLIIVLLIKVFKFIIIIIVSLVTTNVIFCILFLCLLAFSLYLFVKIRYHDQILEKVRLETTGGRALNDDSIDNFVFVNISNDDRKQNYARDIILWMLRCVLKAYFERS